MNFIVHNQEYFRTNSAVCSVNARNQYHLPRPTTNMSCFWKHAYYGGTQIFNNLTCNLESLMNEKAQFKV